MSLGKGGPQNAFSEKVGHLAQLANPPTRKLGRQKKKKSLMSILHFRLYILNILFFHEKFHFLVGTTTWGVQDPHELIRYCSPTYV